MIAFECIHAIQRTDWEEFCVYKLDLSKAYDRVDWGFFLKKKLMEKLGFQSKWVQWVMTCVSTVRY